MECMAIGIGRIKLGKCSFTFTFFCARALSALFLTCALFSLSLSPSLQIPYEVTEEGQLVAREGFEVGFQVRDKELYRGEFLDGLRHHLGAIRGCFY